MKNKSLLPKNAKKVFKGKIFDVYQWDQKMFDNSIEVFEKIKRTNTAVVIPIAGGKILIQEQEQPHRKYKFLSLPGGRCEKNEKPLFAAKREMLEETGYVSNDWELWKTINPLEKILWKVYIYIARNCEKVSGQKLDSGEKMNIRCTFSAFARKYKRASSFVFLSLS